MSSITSRDNRLLSHNKALRLRNENFKILSEYGTLESLIEHKKLYRRTSDEKYRKGSNAYRRFMKNRSFIKNNLIFERYEETEHSNTPRVNDHEFSATMNHAADSNTPRVSDHAFSATINNTLDEMNEVRSDNGDTRERTSTTDYHDSAIEKCANCKRNQSREAVDKYGISYQIQFQRYAIISMS